MAEVLHGNSSVGRALVSKTRCREFEPLFPCLTYLKMKSGILTNIQEAYEELRYKTSWPTQTQLIKSAIIVLIASVIISLIIFFMDVLVNGLMHFIYSFQG